MVSQKELIKDQVERTRKGRTRLQDDVEERRIGDQALC